ncbi:MAG: hypothetical protein D6690_01470 [Nitrospirae bacterium]|nr:MAG: hypothetical protein D6690_01470 [Nitrospirota bacterium]
MDHQEVQRAIQYITARTSYSRDAISQVVTTGLNELAALAETRSQDFAREALLEYITHWTIRKTGLPEPMVREILDCAGRWLDDMVHAVETHAPELLDQNESSAS